MGRIAGLLAITIALGGCAHSPPGCGSVPGDRPAIERSIRGFFSALARKDEAAVRALTTASFYSYDGGGRYTAPELLDVVRQAHGRGMQLNWNIGAIDTHARCDFAWTAWENSGSAGIPPDVSPVTWLESAVLRKEGSAWKLEFLHSSRKAR